MVSVTDGNLPANALSASLWAFLLSGVVGLDEVLPDEAIPDGAGPDEGAAGPFHLYVAIFDLVFAGAGAGAATGGSGGAGGGGASGGAGARPDFSADGTLPIPIVCAPCCDINLRQLATVSCLFMGNNFWPGKRMGGTDIDTGVWSLFCHGPRLCAALVENKLSGGRSIRSVNTLGKVFFRRSFFFDFGASALAAMWRPRSAPNGVSPENDTGFAYVCLICFIPSGFEPATDTKFWVLPRPVTSLLNLCCVCSARFTSLIVCVKL